MNDVRRRRLRVILLVASIPFTIAALVLAGKLIGLSPTAQQVIGSYDRGAYDRAAQDADGLHDGNWFEPWIASFDRGTAYAANGLYNDAIDDLERAFDFAPAAKKCDVAVNLSLSWERLGDSYVQQGLFAGAERLYETARAVIDAAGEECQPPNAPQNEEEDRDPGQELSDAADRLDAKADRSGRAGPQTEGDDAAGGGLDDQLDQLGQREDEAAEEKAEQQGQDRGENSRGGFTDKPW